MWVYRRVDAYSYIARYEKGLFVKYMVGAKTRIVTLLRYVVTLHTRWL